MRRAFARTWASTSVDINFGCPVNKVVKCNGGSGLLRDLPLVERLLRAVRAAISIPLTMKYRAGWNDRRNRRGRHGAAGGRLRLAGRGAASAHARTGLQRTGRLAPHRGGQGGGQDPGDRQRRYRHARGRRAHDARNRLRRRHDRPRGGIESVDLPPDPRSTSRPARTTSPPNATATTSCGATTPC